MERKDGSRSTSKAFSQLAGSPRSRRRLIWYSPTAATGPTSDSPATSGKISWMVLSPASIRAATSPTIG